MIEEYRQALGSLTAVNPASASLKVGSGTILGSPASNYGETYVKLCLPRHDQETCRIRLDDVKPAGDRVRSKRRQRG